METKHNHHVLPRLYLKGFVEVKRHPFIGSTQRDENLILEAKAETTHSVDRSALPVLSRTTMLIRTNREE
jgi:hypothetical protein